MQNLPVLKRKEKTRGGKNCDEETEAKIVNFHNKQGRRNIARPKTDNGKTEFVTNIANLR